MSSTIDVAAIFDAKREIRIFRFVMFVVTLILAIYSYIAFGTPRVSDKIYSNLQSNHYCSRRLNATHQMGCTSALGGNQGVVWIVKNQVDLDHVLKTGPTPPYVVMLGHKHFTRDNLLSFKYNTDRVSGVIFENDDPSAPPTPFSPDDVCPNRYSGLYSNDTDYKDCQKNEWQKRSQISGLLYEDIPYPIFFMNDPKSLEQIRECFKRNIITLEAGVAQGSYPLCGIQLDSFMLAAVNTETCLNSHSIVDELMQTSGRRCVNVEDHNIFSYYKTAQGMPTHQEGKIYTPHVTDKQSIVMLVAKLSSLSMFTGISPGADSTITSIVTLMAIAEALGRVEIRNNSKVVESKNNIAFALFDSESFDYIGSTAMVELMKNNALPAGPVLKLENPVETISNTNLSSLNYVVNLDQLAPHGEQQTFYLHSDPQEVDKDKINKFSNSLSTNAAKLNFTVGIENELPLPPTSVHPFIKESRAEKSDSKLTGIVLGNYGKTYTNPFYNSIHDDALSVGLSLSKNTLVEHLKHVSTIIARSIYEITFGDVIDVETNGELITEMLECYLVNSNCSLFIRVLPAGHSPLSGPVSTYRDATKGSDDYNRIIAQSLLSYFLGDRYPKYNKTQCYQENELSRVYNYHYINGKDKPVESSESGLCIRTQTSESFAQSPGYKQTPDYIAIDRQYPVWTASYEGIRNPVRLFMIPSPLYTWSIFLFGLFTTSMSFLVVNRCKRAIICHSLREEPTST